MSEEWGERFVMRVGSTELPRVTMDLRPSRCTSGGALQVLGRGIVGSASRLDAMDLISRCYAIGGTPFLKRCWGWTASSLWCDVEPDDGAA